jgi:hypothetical protein
MAVMGRSQDFAKSASCAMPTLIPPVVSWQAIAGIRFDVRRFALSPFMTLVRSAAWGAFEAVRGGNRTFAAVRIKVWYAVEADIWQKN